jgi:hypothetical protein
MGRAALSIRARIHEDGRSGTPCKLRVDPPESYTESEEGLFSGPLRSSWSIFEVETEPYGSDWTCRFSADASRIGSASEVGG